MVRTARHVLSQISFAMDRIWMGDKVWSCPACLVRSITIGNVIVSLGKALYFTFDSRVNEYLVICAKKKKDLVRAMLLKAAL